MTASAFAAAAFTPRRVDARAEAQIAIEVLLQRLPSMTLAIPVGQLAWRPSFRTRGPAHLPVKLA